MRKEVGGRWYQVGIRVLSREEKKSGVGGWGGRLPSAGRSIHWSRQVAQVRLESPEEKGQRIR